MEPLADQLREAFQIQSPSATVDTAAFGNRLMRRMAIEWRFKPSARNRRLWAADYRRTVDFEVLHQDIEFIAFTFSRSTEAAPFGMDNRPTVTLADASRSSRGAIRLAEPHRSTGASFAFKIYFDPPLRKGDTASIDAVIQFPEYKLGVRDDLVRFLLKSGAALRDHEFIAREIDQPTQRFECRVLLPKELGATPLDPEVRRSNVIFQDEQDFIRDQPGAFGISEEEVDGKECWVLEIRRDNPPYNASYRLRWRLPSEHEVGLADAAAASGEEDDGTARGRTKPGAAG
jgi:hypothetical protein